MKGQLDISFQWIYVVLAGGAFLLIFFLAFRACTQNEEARTESFGLRSAASMLSAGIWQPESIRNITINAEVACIGGTLTLTNGASSSQIQRSAVFMPPILSGRSSFVTEEIQLVAPGVPGISYGNVLYVFDENTHYYRIGETGFPATEVTPATLRTTDIPGSARSVIIVTNENIDLAALELPQTDAAVYGVVVHNGMAQFYGQEGGARLRTTADPVYAGVLAKGAMIAGTHENFACAKAGFIQRAQDIASIYVQRSALLMSDMPPACHAQHNIVSTMMDQTRTDQEFLEVLTDDRILTAQQSLYSMNCPVIA